MSPVSGRPLRIGQRRPDVAGGSGEVDDAGTGVAGHVTSVRRVAGVRRGPGRLSGPESGGHAPVPLLDAEPVIDSVPRLSRVSSPTSTPPPSVRMGQSPASLTAAS